MYLDACSLSQPGASIGRVKKEGDAIMQGGLPESGYACKLPREGRSHLHGPWTECRLRGEEKTRPAVSRRPVGRQRLRKGCKRWASPGQRGQGKLEGADQAQASSSVVRAGARVRRAPPVGDAAPRGAETDSESPVNLRSR